MADPTSELESRVERLAQGTDLGWVAHVLAARRDEVLRRWLEATRRQPFHQDHGERAVADHIPRLFDALVDLMLRTAPRWMDAEAPLTDEAVLEAAQAHARARFTQGLQATDIVAEFRLLRQEIGRALRMNLTDAAPTGDVIGAELLVHDALDGAISFALGVLTSQIEEVRQEVLAATVHDIQQPLTAIKASLQLAGRLLARPQPAIEQALAHLHGAEAQADRLVTLIRGLADASRLALGHLELRRAQTDLAQLVQNVVQRLPADELARVRVDLPPGLDPIGHWDGELLERVIANLLSNAVKYSPPGKLIHVVIQDLGEAIQLSVRDHGMGLAPDELADLFRRYRRAHRAAASGTGGQGLGLYLSRGIVEAHGGRIWAESPGPDQGSTFHVLLPRDRPDDEARGSDSPPGAAA